MNFETYDNNRSTTLLQLLEEEERIDYKRFKRIKYDHQLPTPLQYNYMDLNPLFDMKVADYPEVSTLLKTFIIGIELLIQHLMELVHMLLYIIS